MNFFVIEFAGMCYDLEKQEFVDGPNGQCCFPIRSLAEKYNEEVLEGAGKIATVVIRGKSMVTELTI